MHSREHLLVVILFFASVWSLVTCDHVLWPWFENILNDPENFIEANSLSTPNHIQPEWYFLWLYAILRSIPNKLGGVIALLMAILIIYLPPVYNRPKATIAFCPINQHTFFIFFLWPVVWKVCAPLHWVFAVWPVSNFHVLMHQLIDCADRLLTKSCGLEFWMKYGCRFVYNEVSIMCVLYRCYCTARYRHLIALYCETEDIDNVLSLSLWLSAFSWVWKQFVY